MLMSSNDQVARLEGGITYDVQMRVCTGYMAKKFGPTCSIRWRNILLRVRGTNSGHRIDYSM